MSDSCTDQDNFIIGSQGEGNTTLISRHYLYNICVELIQNIDEYTNILIQMDKEAFVVAVELPN